MDKINRQIFDGAYCDALNRNADSIRIYEERKTNLENLHLKYYTDFLTVPTLVPIGKKVLIRGNLINTNNFTVALSNEYFVKCSFKQADQLRQHRMQYIDHILQKLKNENKYLLQHTTSVKEYVFNNDGQEIVEPYDEDEDKMWREKHKLNIKNYKRMKAEDAGDMPEDFMARLDELELQEEIDDMSFKESAEYKKTKLNNSKVADEVNTSYGSPAINMSNDIECNVSKMNKKDILNKLKMLHSKFSAECKTEQDVFQRLDELEEEEMLQDELDRLTTTSEESCEEPSAIEEDLSESERTEVKRKISFDYTEKSVETMTINFSHGEDTVCGKNKSNTENGLNTTLESPSDIYSSFSECFVEKSKPLKSILKSSSSSKVPNFTNSFSNDNGESEDQTEPTSPSVRSIIVGDIVENKDFVRETHHNRPLSKFKAMRQKTKNTS